MKEFMKKQIGIWSIVFVLSIMICVFFGEKLSGSTFGQFICMSPFFVYMTYLIFVNPKIEQTK